MTDTRIPEGISGARLRILETALKEWDLKVVEKPFGSNRGPEVDKYLPSFWLKKKKGPSWCAFFAGWVAKEALGDYLPGGRLGSCMALRDAAKKSGQWVAKTYGGPVPGDAFVMDTDGDKGSHGHIGYVLRVSVDGKQINTLEGNCGQRVQLGLRETSDPKIIGWINTVPSEKPEFERGVIDAKKVGAEGPR
jgi:hypothetical protein